MGIFFIAAGTSSKNRQKTLDKGWSLSSITPFLPPQSQNTLRSHFSSDDSIYLWGANETSFNQLQKVRTGEYAVDVKNKTVVQVFEYCFHIFLPDGRLQQHVGWDKEKPFDKRRPYKYVYFLKKPRKPQIREKAYFQNALGREDNQNWLVGQRYFSDDQVSQAMARTESSSVEEFLGLSIPTGHAHSTPNRVAHAVHSQDSARPRDGAVPDKPRIPIWLNRIFTRIQNLKSDRNHYERDHEDLVVMLFEQLGYERIDNIKFRRGNIDILIERDGNSLMTIEVKADWNLNSKQKPARQQAFQYAHESGSPYVIITNGDTYLIYDRRKGLSYQDQYLGEFTVSRIDSSGVELLKSLTPDKLS